MRYVEVIDKTELGKNSLTCSGFYHHIAIEANYRCTYYHRSCLNLYSAIHAGLAITKNSKICR
jgi:hypothetical protein